MQNFFNISRKLDNFRKGILQTDPTDEPTYLTFGIEFDFLSSKDYRDKIVTSPLFNTNADGQSACNYLANRGLQNEAAWLNRMVEILRFLQNEAPWYFQAITGLDKLWADATNMKNNFKGSEKILTVETLEAVDLRVTEIADLYRKSMYDMVFMREKVPDNLRWFKMDVYVAEIRNLRNVLPQIAGIDLGNGGGILGAGNQFGNILENFGFHKFECYQCEFDFSKSFAPGTEAVDAIGKDKPESNRFDIKVGWYKEGNIWADSVDTSESYKNRFDLTNNFGTNLPIVGNSARSLGIKAQNTLSKLSNVPATLINSAISDLQAAVENGNLGQSTNIGYEFNGDVRPDPSKLPQP